MLSPADIVLLARAYAAAEGVSLGTVGLRACNNNKVFRRLIDGKGANSSTLATAERFFRNEWPAGAAWPDTVPTPPGRRSRRRRSPGAGPATGEEPSSAAAG